MTDITEETAEVDSSMEPARHERPTRVLFVLNSFGTGGSERVVLDICRGVDRSRFTPHVVALYGGPLSDAFSAADIWNECLDKRDGIDFGLMRRIVKIVKQRDIDVINAHHFSPFVHSCGTLLSRPNRLIYTDHTVREVSGAPPKWALFARLAITRCFGVLGISNEIADELRNKFHVPADKVFTIPNAIDIDRFENREDPIALRRELRIPDDCKVVGVVGNLRLQKNHEALIRAFRILLDGGTRAKLLIIGEGDQKLRLESLREDLGLQDDVLMLGARHDIPALYQLMDAYCLSSFYEGLPLTILEAMASGVPIVGTDVIGIREVIRNEITGLLVSCDPESIAQGISSYLNNPDKAKTLAQAGFDYVRSVHSMQPWIRSYEQLFDAACRAERT